MAPSEAIRVDLIAGAPRPQIVVPPRKWPQRVLITCAFGLAVVSVAFNEQLQALINLPAAGTWDWTLAPNEGLVAVTTVTTVLTGVRRDLV